jgi:hypothetical protein
MDTSDLGMTIFATPLVAFILWALPWDITLLLLCLIAGVVALFGWACLAHKISVYLTREPR